MEKIFFENSHVCVRKTGNFKDLLPANWLTSKNTKIIALKKTTNTVTKKYYFVIEFLISQVYFRDGNDNVKLQSQENARIIFN